MSYKDYQKGELLQDRYLKINDISEGSYGLVTLAKDTRENKLVAVKYIYPLSDEVIDSKSSISSKLNGNAHDVSSNNKNNNNKINNNDISKNNNSKENIKENIKENDKKSSLNSFKNDNKTLNSNTKKKLYDEALKEISIHEKLGHHQNIATLFDHFDSYLILEYCSRGDLYEAIKTNQGPSLKNDIIDVMLQLTDVIEFIHSNSVYHRDIKPENILIAEDWSIKLTDWGLASTQRYCTDFEVGSERYMAPELFDHENIEEYDAEKVDLWSIGIVLLNLIFHKNPFKVANHSDKLFVHFASNRDVLFDIFPTMAFELFGVLRFCLTIDPDNRSLSKMKQELLKINVFTIDEEFDEDELTEIDKMINSPNDINSEDNEDEDDDNDGEDDDEIESDDLDLTIGEAIENPKNASSANSSQKFSSTTNLKPIPIHSKPRRNTRKPLALPSYKFSMGSQNAGYNRQDFFTPKSVWNHYMDKIDKNKSSVINDVKRRPWRIHNNSNNKNNNNNIITNQTYNNKNINNNHHHHHYNGNSYNGNSYNGNSYNNSYHGSYKRDSYYSKKSTDSNSYKQSNSYLSSSYNQNIETKKKGKYIPPNLRSPHKSPTTSLQEEIGNLDLDDDDVFMLEENYAGELKKPKSPGKSNHINSYGSSNVAGSIGSNGLSNGYNSPYNSGYTGIYNPTLTGYSQNNISGNTYNSYNGFNGSTMTANPETSIANVMTHLHPVSATSAVNQNQHQNNTRVRSSSFKKNLPCNKDGIYIPPNRRGSHSGGRPVVVKPEVGSSSVPLEFSMNPNMKVNMLNNSNWFKLKKNWDEIEDNEFNDGFYNEFLNDKKFESIISTG